MKTEIVKIAPENFSDAQLMNAATLLKNGGLVAFPTETVYGLGANALDAEACNHIFDAKGRPRDNPLIVHVLNPEDCLLYAVPGRSERLFWELAERFMPGPLTIIMPKKSIIPDSVTVISDWAFCECKKLNRVTIPDSVNEIGEGAFCNCVLLDEVEIPDSVMKIDDCAFRGCTSLERVREGNGLGSV